MVLALLYWRLSTLIHSPGLIQFDQTVTRNLQGLRHPWLDALMIFFTLLGTTPFLVIVGLLVAVTLHRRGLHIEGVYCALSLLALPINAALKFLFPRVRPNRAIVQVLLENSGLSFPSGHAMVTLIFCGFLAYLLWTSSAADRKRRLQAMGLLLLAFCIAVSRVYVGVHWFSDIVGGWIAGLFCLIVLITGYRYAVNRTEVMPGRIAGAPRE